jgi:4-hydroxy-3-polyprenylbenzoate decarboxylase
MADARRSYRDLREFISFLEDRGQLKRVTSPVTWDLEITEITDRTVKSGGPALLFEKVEGYEIPVLINTFGTAERAAWALGVDHLDDLQGRVQETLKLTQGPPSGVMNKLRMLGDLATIARIGPSRAEEPASQQIVIAGDDVDLFQIPVLRCWPEDAGRYLTLPLVITKDPDTGVHNLGMYRMQVFDRNTTGMHWQTHKVGTHHQRMESERGNQRMEVAVAFGGDPATIWAGSAPLPPDVSEYLLAGFIRGKPVPVAKGVTVDLDVPAEAEYVLEGYVDPSESRTEGPFGDHTGYYSIESEYPVFHVTAITRRRDPIYPTIVVGRPVQEDYWMGKASERMFLPLMRLILPEVVDVNMPAEGIFHNLVIVSIKKEYPGHPQKVAYGLWGLGLMMLAKTIVVVDHDVDVQDLSLVTWRVTNNIDGRRDVFFADGPVDDLDVGSPTPKIGSKIGIDATRKTAAEMRDGKHWMPDILMTPEIKSLVDGKWTEYGI